MKILIADDSAWLRRQLVRLLSDLDGIQIVGEATAAQEALHAIRRLKPDLVTLDIQMLGGSGIDVLKAIKQDDHVPVVIMLTNHASAPYRKTALQAGADFFFDKANEFEEVRPTIQKLLEQSGTRKAAAP